MLTPSRCSKTSRTSSLSQSLIIVVLQAFQKDAILRRMKEYQREAKTAKEDLEDVRKQSQYHDEHLRTIDSWFLQLIDEIAVSCNDIPAADRPAPFTPFESSLLIAKGNVFDRHLRQKSDQIKKAISQLFSDHGHPEPELARLRQVIVQLISKQKSLSVERQSLENQTVLLEERLENASMRYMMAEKKVDRMKSLPVQKLEAQAMQPPKTEEEIDAAADPMLEGSKQVNGIQLPSSAEADAARREAIASRDTTKEHLDKLAEENRRLQDDLTAAKSKSVTLSDEDYSHTELYKTLKSQHEDVLKRVNDLQAVHTQLRADIKHLQAERSKYKQELEQEQNSAISESEGQVTRLGLDLTRIRNERDNALQQLSFSQAERKDTSESDARNAEINTAKDKRISLLESEIERLRVTAQGKASEGAEDLSALDEATLRTRLQLAEDEKKMLMQELGGMEASYKKAIAAGSQKLSHALDLEERLARTTAEKEKANQKYFQTEKSKQAQFAELSSLRKGQAKTSEVVTAHKETEKQLRSQTIQLEKQIADLRDSIATIEKNHRDLQQREYDFKTKSERFALQLAEVQKQLTAKDELLKTAQQTSRQSEIETSELRVRLEEAEKNVEMWKKRSMGTNNDEYEMLKQIATCTICRKNFKEVALTKCGHVFCGQCVDERYNSRARKCPNCNTPFGQNDRVNVTL